MPEQKLQSVQCACCRELLLCMADDIKLCGCSQVTISDELRAYFHIQFSGCLCNGCLINLRSEYRLLAENREIANE